jgi:hypothetical protein
VTAASALILGSGGFSAAQVDRGVSVSAADHDEAVVSLWDPGAERPPDHAGEDPVTGSETKVLVVQNRLDEPIHVTVTDREGSLVDVAGSVDEVDSRLGHDPVVPVEATVDCRGYHGEQSVPLLVEFRTTDGTVGGEIRYDATVECPPESAQTGNSTDA